MAGGGWEGEGGIRRGGYKTEACAVLLCCACARERLGPGARVVEWCVVGTCRSPSAVCGARGLCRAAAPCPLHCLDSHNPLSRHHPCIQAPPHTPVSVSPPSHSPPRCRRARHPPGPPPHWHPHHPPCCCAAAGACGAARPGCRHRCRPAHHRRWRPHSLHAAVMGDRQSHGRCCNNMDGNGE